MEDKIIQKDLCYRINGLLFKVHNELGRYCREKQYGDLFESILKSESLDYEREKNLPLDEIDNQRTNVVDFIIDGMLLIDLKAKSMVTKDDYYQMQRYLKASKLKLGLIVNFSNEHLKPIRVIRHNS
jgi:GxxExxY protein